MKNYRYIYFIGIGGIGMSALARWFHHAGYSVSGYDRTPSAITAALQEEGISVHFESAPSLIPAKPEETLVIYTPAIPAGMEEMIHVSTHGYKMVKRAEALGLLTRGQRCLAVAGTHGKTSTSTMLAHFLTEAGVSCSAFLGGISKNYGTNLLIGTGGTVVAEADEFDRSFLQLHPEAAVITSIDPDHLDIYSGIEDLRRTFLQFASQTSQYLVIKENLAPLFCSRGLSARIFTYGPTGDFAYTQVRTQGSSGLMYFTLRTPFGDLEDCHAGVPGEVYVENATAAAALALLHGAEPDRVRAAISSYSGVVRRFDIRLNIPGHTYIDDYAHHPAEIAATIASVRQVYPGRRICGIFQPHLYSRTRDLYREFAESLNRLDSVILLPIYPAREEPIPGVDSRIILKEMTLEDRKITGKEELVRELQERDTDIVITFGAGDIDRLVSPIENMLRAKYV